MRRLRLLSEPSPPGADGDGSLSNIIRFPSERTGPASSSPPSRGGAGAYDPKAMALLAWVVGWDIYSVHVDRLPKGGDAA